MDKEETFWGGLSIVTTEDGQFSVQRQELNCIPVAPKCALSFEVDGDYHGWMRERLQDLSLLVESSDICVMVVGKGGCGKSSLLRSYCSHVRGEDVVFLHLGDQIDSKTLLGTYVCTATPGEFMWLPGVLTQAVASGKWVIMEDIQCAPPDVVSLLLPLVKSKKLIIPGYAEPLLASPIFKLFLTQRVAEDHATTYSGFLGLLQQHVTVFHLPMLSSSELQQVLYTKFSNLMPIIDDLITTVFTLNIHPRCVVKLCKRVSPQVHDGQVFNAEDMMLELMDCFCGHLSGFKKVELALQLRSLCGGIAKEKVEQLCTAHKPVLQISPTSVTVGRAYIPCTSTVPSTDIRYVGTQHSLCLLEQVCRCVQMNEPVLLVGETGVGKTLSVGYLSKIAGHKLVVVNMSQQTDSADLLGGFKPVQMTHLMSPLREEFEKLFHETFSVKQNAQFLSSVQEAYHKVLTVKEKVCFVQHQWKKLFKLMISSYDSALNRLQVSKKVNMQSLLSQWLCFGRRLKKIQKQLNKPQTVFAFDFVEGALVQCVQKGWWILLDEVNLASPDTLQCLSSLLESTHDSFILTEKANMEAVQRHPDFRLFCCMNPATDVGKKSLPNSIRNRFTEFYVNEPESTSDLRCLILDYLQQFSPTNTLVDGVISLYQSMKKLSATRLQDGTGRAPHYSLRNLCRTLLYAANNPCFLFLKSLYEGSCLAFLSELKQDYHKLVIDLVQKCLKIPYSVLASEVRKPSKGEYVLVEKFWLSVGSEKPHVPDGYVLTSSVKTNLRNLARVASARCHPVLLQGPTSAGKTSLVQYLATCTGHRCVRINNHEHTDLQDYIGSYMTNSMGELCFQEGVLINAMRKGYWVILDELNLAPCDVLEALNRVLDDNRELFISETQEVVQAHPRFMLFGTQNPPGLYAGRKALSRAFRNRFIELHYEDIPADELATILMQKCSLPQTYAKKMIAVMKELQQRRSFSGVFAGKYGLITLRDLFRWAERYRRSPICHQFHDWEQQLAEDGYMLLGGRLRNPTDELAVLEVIEKHFKRKVVLPLLFGIDGSSGSVSTAQSVKLLKSPLPLEFSHLVWTPELLRMVVLVHRALSFHEPVLLVGGTGCGKTTICQFLSYILENKLYSINCHMHTEAADFLGGLRPARRKSSEESDSGTHLFEWSDGVLVKAMNDGGFLLIDEISLAEDAVLERLNSVLEPARKLLISERASEEDVCEIFAQEGFNLVATMNPGGDYGKKELSPSLRNRFVEIWCPSTTSRGSFERIISHNLRDDIEPPPTASWAVLMLDFLENMQEAIFSLSFSSSVRDLLSWATFMNATVPKLSAVEAFSHGAHLVFLDSLGSSGNPTVLPHKEACSAAIDILQALLRKYGINLSTDSSASESSFTGGEIIIGDKLFGVSPFFIEIGCYPAHSVQSYSFEALGPRTNVLRLLRAMQLGKPLLLEGAPGVGKTSLVAAMAQCSGHHVTRINLSEHTDITDLFGADLPVEGGVGVCFEWKDGPFLKALKNGDWILLDEMNLASQTVLEGLNACLDHRGEVYIPELGMSFKVQANTRLFACQNPLQQGGGRKGLPKSFMNRFTQVYIEALSSTDLLIIATSIFSEIEGSVLSKMIEFNTKVESLLARKCGQQTWEFNLRDVLRWCELLKLHMSGGMTYPVLFVDTLYCQRLRTKALREEVYSLCVETFSPWEVGPHIPSDLGCYFNVTRESVQIGHCFLEMKSYRDVQDLHSLLPLHCQMSTMEALMTCVQMGWMSILVGGKSSGKLSVVSVLAQLTGHKLVEFPMNSNTDTTELLGGFEQLNFSRHCSNIASSVLNVAIKFQSSILKKIMQKSTLQLKQLSSELSVLVLQLKSDFSPAVLLDESPESDVAQLISLQKYTNCLSSMFIKVGFIVPKALTESSQLLEDLSEKVQSVDTVGQFEWVDSNLVQAMIQGHWCLISNANLCKPAVLDRLNALLEPGGVLHIDEQGATGNSIRVVKPHPDFRLFLAMNPSYGEISRAMRNRGVEIFILPEVYDDEGLPLYNSSPFLSSTNVLNLTTSPDEVIVQRDVVPVVSCLNSINQRNEVVEKALTEITAALEVFIIHSSTDDVSCRLACLEQLNNQSCQFPRVKVELQACFESISSVVKDAGAHKQFYISSFSCSADVFPTSNPHSLCCLGDEIIASHRLYVQWRVGLLRNLLKEHAQMSSVKRSVVQLSHQAATGVLPLEMLPHCSYTYLYTFLTNLIEVTLCFLRSDEVSLSVTLDDLCLIADWLMMLTQSWMDVEHDLTQIAVVWNVFRTECLCNILTIINDGHNSLISSISNKLDSLTEIAVQGIMFFSIKEGIGYPKPMTRDVLQLRKTMSSRDADNLKDCEVKYPLVLLTKASMEKREALALLYQEQYHRVVIDKEKFEVPEDHVVVGDHPITAEFSDAALIPTKFCLKTLTLDLLKKRELKESALQSLLNYCLQLAFVPLISVKPLLEILVQPEGYDLFNFLPHLIDYCLSGCSGLDLIPSSKVTEDKSEVLIQGHYTDMCFKLLSPLQDSSVLKVLPAFTIGNYPMKTTEVETLLQHIWLHSFSVAFCPTHIINLDFQWLNELFNHLVAALQRTLVHCLDDPSEFTGKSTFSTQDLSDMCSAASSIASHSCLKDFWRQTQHHLLTAQKELCLLAEVLKANAPSTALSESSLQSSMQIVKIHLGVALSLMLCPTEVDPLMMKKVKNQCFEKILFWYSGLSDAFTCHYSAMVGKVPTYTTSHIDNGGTSSIAQVSTLERKHYWTARLKEIEAESQERLNSLKYSTLVQICNDLIKTQCSPQRVQSIMESAKLLVNDQNTLPPILSWSKATSAAANKLINDFEDFEDVVQPFVMALKLVLSGISTLTTVSSYSHSEKGPILEVAHLLLQYPHFYSVSRFRCVNYFTKIAKEELKGIIVESLPTFQKRVVRIAVSVCHIHFKTSCVTNPKWEKAALALLDLCFSIWQQMDELARKQAEQEGSLYKYKTVTHCVSQSESTVEEQQSSTLFPSFDDYFTVDVPHVVEESCSLGKKDVEVETGACYTQFTDEEMWEVCHLHLLMYSNLYHQVGTSCDDITSNLTNDAYHLGNQLISLTGCVPGGSVDYSLCGVHARKCHQLLRTLNSSSFIHEDRIVPLERNVYKDSFVSEVKRVLPVLSRLTSRVDGLLEHWPEHPGLQQIKRACEKVYSLDLQEPLMMILSGLEYILRKAQDWEAYASSHVSLFSELQSLTELILDWRKLELKCWKKLLPMCKENARLSAAKWWFHIFSLCKAETTGPSDDFIDAIRQFVETCSLGEFQTRLLILDAFSYSSFEGADVCNVLCNVVQYYKQFLPVVESSFAQSAAPIEKDFKDFLSILLWNDSNYWALKATIEKSHRTTVQFLNKYEAVVQQPVQPLLSSNSLKSHCVEKAKSLLHFLTSGQIDCLSHCDITRLEVFGSVLTVPIDDLHITVMDAFRRMKALVHRFSTGLVCISWITVVDRLSDDVCDIHSELQSTEFLKGVEEEKRMAAIKLSSTMKRKALNDLFKTLKKEGLSYRKGIEFFKENILSLLRLPCPTIPLLTGLIHQDKIFDTWSDIQSYFYLSLSRMAAFDAALVNPSKELTVGQLTRCKGFAYHLMMLVCEQRKVISRSTRVHARLKYMLQRLKLLSEDEDLQVLKVNSIRHWQDRLESLMEQCLECVSALKSILASRPKQLDFSLTPFLKKELPPLVSVENTGVIETRMIEVEAHVPALRTLKDEVSKHLRANIDHAMTFSIRTDFSLLNQGYDCVAAFHLSISKLQCEIVGENNSLGMLKFLTEFGDHATTTCREFNEWTQGLDETLVSQVADLMSECKGSSTETDHFVLMQEVMSSLLLCVQRVCTKQLQLLSVHSSEDCPMCIENLNSYTVYNILQCSCEHLVDNIGSLMERLLHFQKSELVGVAVLYPLLDQWMCFYDKLLLDLLACHFSLSRFLNDLLEMFITLATRGFCTPDLSTDNQSAGTDFVDIEAGGFEDGEGLKNVSEDAESENVDAGQSGQEKSEDASEVHGNEAAIDVKDDFGGSLEDIAEQSEEDTASDNEESDMDKQVGDLGAQNPSDLDREMWAGEIEDEEETMEKQESGGGTATEEENTIVAKEDLSESAVSDKQPANSQNPHEEPEEAVSDTESQLGPPPNNQEEPEGSYEEEDIQTEDIQELNIEQTLSEGEEETVNGDIEQLDDMDVENLSLNSDKEQMEQPLPSDMDIEESVQCVENETMSSGATPNEFEQNKSSDESQQSLGESSNAENKGTGLSEVSHTVASDSKPEYQKRKRPKVKDDRCGLADSSEIAVKRPRILESMPSDSGKEERHEKKHSAFYQHLLDDDTLHDAVAWDAAPIDQSGLPLHDRNSIHSEDEEENMDATTSDEVAVASNATLREVDPGQHDTTSQSESAEKDTGITADSDKLSIQKMRDGHLQSETYFHTGEYQIINCPLTGLDSRKHLQVHMAAIPPDVRSTDASAEWLKYEQLTNALSQVLCEELRLVLEPASANQLKGDFRSGKRLNMRKIIPYIASNFQNDRIWLRKVKPSKREYQILLAVDDSSSMKENGCDQIAYESLALISNALNRLECGQFGVCRFGESVEMLHPLDQPFSSQFGGHILQHLNFEQSKTNFALLLQAAHGVFLNSLQTQSRRSGISPDINQLLIILSDGRGVFTSGTLEMQLSVRKMTELRVFTVFVIIDGLSKDSITDVMVPSFSPGKPPLLQSYLDVFPFPFYIVLREITALPMVLAQALRQWFELVTNQT